MRIKSLIAILASLALPLVAGAQTLNYVQADNESDYGVRISAGVDWKIIPKKLHLEWNEEVRTEDGFDFSKLYSSLGLDYRITPWLKAGAEYSFINSHSEKKGWRNRHRGRFSLTGYYKAGRMTLSLRETVQATCKDYSVNNYQEPQIDAKLKSRLKFEYDIPACKFDPFASAEVRNTLNAVNAQSFTYDSVNDRWNASARDYSDIYIDRLRFTLGGTLKMRKIHELDIFAVLDCNYDLDIDTNSEGLEKRDLDGKGYGNSYPMLTLKDKYFVGLGLAYRFEL